MITYVKPMKTIKTETVIYATDTVTSADNPMPGKPNTGLENRLYLAETP
jgi:hypothetical protein